MVHETARKTNRKSHFETIAEQPASVSNTKLPYEIAPDPPLVIFLMHNDEREVL